jgi:hypothetical protein
MAAIISAVGGFVAAIFGFAWRLSARLTRIEDNHAGLPCRQGQPCPSGWWPR